MHVRLWMTVASFFTLTACQSGYYSGPLSDHFDGLHFYNPKQFVKTKKLIPVKLQTKEKITFTFTNHATYLISSNHIHILTDPVFSYRVSPSVCIGPARWQPPGISFNHLPRIDYVIISHNHYDHMDLITLKRLEDKFHPYFIVPLGNKPYLEKHHFHHVVELDWWQSYQGKDIRITFLPAKHWSTRWLSDFNNTLWGSYGIELAGKKIFHAGDTAYSNHFTLIGEQWGHPDVALIPIGSYLPRKAYKHVHVDPKEAVKAHLDLGAKKSLAMHFGTFNLSLERMDQPIIDLKRARIEANVSPSEFSILMNGESYTSP